MLNEISGKTKERFEAKFLKVEGDCWLWQASKFPSGYGQFQFEGRPHGAHRISYRLYKGKIPGDLCVCHTCDNPLCVNPDHLFLGTKDDNNKDKAKKKRAYTPPGEKNGSSKLTEVQVREIRKSNAANITLAAIYQVSKSHIERIKARTRWGWLED